MANDMKPQPAGGVPKTELSAIGLFDSLSPRTLDAISSHAVKRRYSDDQHIVLEGDPCEAAYFILQGLVRVYRVSPEGREQTLVRLRAGQAFNTVPPFQKEGRNQASVVAIGTVALLRVPKADFLELVLTHQDLTSAIFRDFANRLVHLTDLVESLALYNVQQRLSRFLLDQAGPEAVDEQPGKEKHQAMNEATHRWTQQEIAAHLGTVRDVIGRALRALENQGVIQLDRGKIVLLDRHELEKRAGR